jgi:serine protease Do
VATSLRLRAGRTVLRAAAAGAIVLGATQAATTPLRAQAAVSPDVVARVHERVYPALVNITVVSQRFVEGRAERYPGAGSGVVLTPQGHVLTNFHVAGHTTRIDCTLTSGRVLQAEVVAHDPLTDLSVLRLIAPPGEAFAHASFGDSDALKVGDVVFAMGNPLALSSSTTQGIVSNPARVFTDLSGTEVEELDVAEGEPSGLFTRWIQHDALILPGNSGGPLVDVEGRVVGINELGGSGMGFAIPSTIARDVLEQSLAHGRVRRGTLGFQVLPVGRIGRTDGALVSSVLPASPAERAGMQPGDVLVALGGQRVEVRFVEQVPLLYQRVASLAIGEEVALELLRRGKPVRVTAKVEELGPFRGIEDEIRELGLTVEEVPPMVAVARQLPATARLVVTGVRPGGPADTARPRLQRGDALLELGETPLATVAALRERVAGWPQGQPMVAGLWREGEELMALVPAPRGPAARFGGELPRAWLGVRTQVVTPELATALGAPDLRGFRLTQVLPGTAAAKAGLAVGDVVTRLGDEALAPARAQDADELRRLVEEMMVGETARLGVWREGQTRAVEVKLDPRPSQADEVARAEHEELEFAVRELTLEDRVRRRWEANLAGVLVADAARGGWAQMAGLRLGDLLLAVNDEPTPTVAEFQRVMKQLDSEKPAVVRLFVRRGARTHFVIVEPDWDEPTTAAEAAR